MLGTREEVTKEIGERLRTLVRELGSALYECAAELGLSRSDAQALWLLEARSPLTTKALARSLDIDPANASMLLTRLERRGLVARRADPDDGRRRLAALTARGRSVCGRLADCVGRRRPSFGALTDEELIAFRDLLRRLG